MNCRYGILHKISVIKVVVNIFISDFQDIFIKIYAQKMSYYVIDILRELPRKHKISLSCF